LQYYFYGGPFWQYHEEFAIWNINILFPHVSIHATGGKTYIPLPNFLRWKGLVPLHFKKVCD
jgi:hypothetical protein